MAKHEPFRFRSPEELLRKADELGVNLPWQDSIDPLFRPVRIGKREIPNRLVVHPMEGYDANPDGSPGELTFRRYTRYAKGGSGIIWFEATAVLKEGRSNPRQLFIHEQNLPDFRRLTDHIRQTVLKQSGGSRSVYLVLQLTHSGRFSKPEGKPRPVIFSMNPFLDMGRKALKVLTENDLEEIMAAFVKAGVLAEKAGFDSVDIKACHGYLLHEFLASCERKDSRYGGRPFENRIRFIQEVIHGIQSLTSHLDISGRISLYDGIPFPYGFGVNPDGSDGMDLTEPVRLVQQLALWGCHLVNGTMGVPLLKAHVNRPFNRQLPGLDPPPEHPLEGVSRLINGIGKVQKAVPKAMLVGTGYSWLRHFFPQVAAGAIHQGLATFVGIGRGSFAYPDAPKDIMNTGKMDRNKVCITCSRCTEMMRHMHSTGCAVRDKKIYGKIHSMISG